MKMSRFIFMAAVKSSSLVNSQTISISHQFRPQLITSPRNFFPHFYSTTTRSQPGPHAFIMLPGPSSLMLVPKAKGSKGSKRSSDWARFRGWFRENSRLVRFSAFAALSSYGTWRTIVIVRQDYKSLSDAYERFKLNKPKSFSDFFAIFDSPSQVGQLAADVKDLGVIVFDSTAQTSYAIVLLVDRMDWWFNWMEEEARKKKEEEEARKKKEEEEAMKKKEEEEARKKSWFSYLFGWK